MIRDHYHQVWTAVTLLVLVGAAVIVAIRARLSR